MTEALQFYRQLDQRGVTAETLGAIRDWSSSEIWALVEHCCIAIPSKPKLRGTPFEFVVNDQLSG